VWTIFSALFLSLILQAMLVFPLRTGFRWLGALTVIMAVLMLYGHPLSKGLPLVIIMSVANFFIGSYAAVTREAEASQLLGSDTSAIYRFHGPDEPFSIQTVQGLSAERVGVPYPN
jgi:hypothetical protein